MRREGRLNWLSWVRGGYEGWRFATVADVDVAFAMAVMGHSPESAFMTGSPAY